MATRLVRGWTHLERQRGGSIGLRGPGETQLETDRRLLQKRVDLLQTRLDKVEVQRTQMRRARVRSEMPRVALVGYTNAGKSTLFNALTGRRAYAADKLFATLDPTVRRIDAAGGSVVLSDTVGFVRDLPHELVAAFRSTLSEAREADLLLHVIDAADDPLRDERIAPGRQPCWHEIGAGDIPQVLVYNKIDRIEGALPRHDPPSDGRERLLAVGARRRWPGPAARGPDRRVSLIAAWSRTCAWRRSEGACARACMPWARCGEEPDDEDGWLLKSTCRWPTAERLAVGGRRPCRWRPCL